LTFSNLALKGEKRLLHQLTNYRGREEREEKALFKAGYDDYGQRQRVNALLPNPPGKFGSGSST